ncbi:DUF2314 domain-containing protein [Novipirellula caenicola]|uniref:DUF2314 domain-containing protein n=1 Tax=Novipirellula caenicola TaxID=1536901 RepID=A0ABP9VSF5_9BACT
MNDNDPTEPLFANLDDDDPALRNAVSAAKRTLPQFVDAFARKRFPSAGYLVKVPFQDRDDRGERALVRTPEVAAEFPDLRVCRLWLAVNSALEDLLFCSVLESPAKLRLKTGASFVVDMSLVEDWMIHCGEVVYGGFSMQVIRNRLPEPDRHRFDQHTGIREFKQLAH